jgi:hypothetical protein
MARISLNRFRNLLDGGVEESGSPALSYKLKLLAECVLLRGRAKSYTSTWTDSTLPLNNATTCVGGIV